MSDPSNELHTHIASLRRYAMALVGNPTDADDLVQESLKRALIYMRSGREIRNLRSYLFTIMHNCRATDLRRSINGGRHVPLDDLAGELPTPANQHHRAELKALLVNLRELPREQQEVLLLVCLEGFAYREAAGILGVPVGTVMSRLSRARKALVERMSAQHSAALKMVK